MAETEDCEGPRVSDLDRFCGTGQNTTKEAAIFTHLLRTSWRKESRDSLSLASSSKDSETRSFPHSSECEMVARSVLAAQANSDEITWPGVSVCSRLNESDQLTEALNSR